MFRQELYGLKREQIVLNLIFEKTSIFQDTKVIIFEK